MEVTMMATAMMNTTVRQMFKFSLIRASSCLPGELRINIESWNCWYSQKNVEEKVLNLCSASKSCSNFDRLGSSIPQLTVLVPDIMSSPPNC